MWNGGRKQTSVIEEQKQKLSFINDKELQIVFGNEVYLVQGDNLAASQIEPDCVS